MNVHIEWFDDGGAYLTIVDPIHDPNLMSDALQDLMSTCLSCDLPHSSGDRQVFHRSYFNHDALHVSNLQRSARRKLVRHLRDSGIAVRVDLMSYETQPLAMAVALVLFSSFTMIFAHQFLMRFFEHI